MEKKEILFRGKHIHAFSANQHLNGRWIEGYLSNENYINSPELEGEFLIDPKTICQYTGLTDKNGRKIFGGDIVKVVDKSRENKIFDIGNISFEEGSWKLCGEILHWLEDVISFEFEVIGNIFDNPELLDSGGKPE